jgi:murein DD-endopeptidase MepM/ murein hydrolase activator NlpD
VPSRPAQATNAAELETLTAVYMINPEPGGRVTSPFGFRKHPVQGGNKRHNGADIAKGLGTKILAMSAGIVVADKDTGSGYGNWVILYHGKIAGKKIYGGYCHNSKVYVKKGDFVNQGQHIADEGATGMVTGSHLHQFTTYGNHDWTNGNYLSNSSSEYIDPIKNFIGKMFTGTVDTSGQLDNGIKGGTTLPNT